MDKEVRLLELLEEAISSWEECAQYKGEYLMHKHGDMEFIAEMRKEIECLK